MGVGDPAGEKIFMPATKALSHASTAKGRSIGVFICRLVGENGIAGKIAGKNFARAVGHPFGKGNADGVIKADIALVCDAILGMAIQVAASVSDVMAFASGHRGTTYFGRLTKPKEGQKLFSKP